MVEPGRLPRIAVLGLVTCKRILAKDIDTLILFQQNRNQKSTIKLVILSEMKSKRNLVLTAIRRPISTDTKTTPKKAPMHAMKSNLSVFHIRITASKSIRPMTAVIMMEARMAFGVYLKRGVKNSSVRNTTADIMILVTAVWQPAM